MDAVDRDRDLPPVYVGQSLLVHYWPWAMVTVALVPLALGALAAVLLLVVPALIFAAILPWRFAVSDRGILLSFGFGKQRFVAKENVTIRAGLGGVLILPRGAYQFGYPVTDGVVDGDRALLR